MRMLYNCFACGRPGRWPKPAWDALGGVCGGTSVEQQREDLPVLASVTS